MSTCFPLPWQPGLPCQSQTQPTTLPLLWAAKFWITAMAIALHFEPMVSSVFAFLLPQQDAVCQCLLLRSQHLQHVEWQRSQGTSLSKPCLIPSPFWRKFFVGFSWSHVVPYPQTSSLSAPKWSSERHSKSTKKTLSTEQQVERH